VQVDPIKPMLKAPGIKRLKLQYHQRLLNIGFKFNLRRYIKVSLLNFFVTLDGLEAGAHTRSHFSST
jgi:hypothetical protein